MASGVEGLGLGWRAIQVSRVVINCWDLDAGFDLRDRLTLRFCSMGQSRVPRGRRSKRPVLA